jgi:tryptophan synthase alpha subunit
MYDGLTIKNGRLINDRPTGTTGIQEACQVKQTMKKAKKLEMYSEAVSLGIQKAKNVEQVKDMFFM